MFNTAYALIQRSRHVMWLYYWIVAHITLFAYGVAIGSVHVAAFVRPEGTSPACAVLNSLCAFCMALALTPLAIASYSELQSDWEHSAYRVAQEVRAVERLHLKLHARWRGTRRWSTYAEGDAIHDEIVYDGPEPLIQRPWFSEPRVVIYEHGSLFAKPVDDNYLWRPGT